MTFSFVRASLDQTILYGAQTAQMSDQVDFLIDISETTDYMPKEKAHIFLSVGKEKDLNPALKYILLSNQVKFIQILAYFDAPTSIEDFFEYLLKDYENSTQIFSLVQSVLESDLTIKQQKMILNSIFNFLTPATFDNLCVEIQVHFDLDGIGQLLFFLENPDLISPFIATVINENNTIEDCKTLIDNMLSLVNPNNPDKPISLILLLNELNNLDKLEIQVIAELERYDEFVRNMILISLPEGCLTDYASEFPAELLTKLVVLEKDPERKSKMIEEFTDSFDRKALLIFLQALISIKSPVIPYLCTGFNEDVFNLFISEMPHSTIQKILNLSVSPSENEIEWIIANLKERHGINRLLVLCDQTEYDLFVPDYNKWFTLKQLCQFIRNSADDLNIDILKEYLAATPAFLFVLGAHCDYYKDICHISKILSDEQISSIGKSLANNPEALDHFFHTLFPDQVLATLNKIHEVQGGHYIRYKSAKLQPSFQEILKRQLEIRRQMKSGINCEEAITVQCSEIRRDILTPQHSILKRYVTNFKNEWRQILEIDNSLCTNIQLCEKYLKELEEFLRKKEPENIKKTSKRIRKPAKKLEKLGIKGPQDEEILAKKAIIYLKQDQLKEIWKFFNEKGLYSLATLKDLIIIQNDDEVFNLMSIAIKMGYEMKEKK